MDTDKAKMWVFSYLCPSVSICDKSFFSVPSVPWWWFLSAATRFQKLVGRIDSVLSVSIRAHLWRTYLPLSVAILDVPGNRQARIW